MIGEDSNGSTYAFEILFQGVRSWRFLPVEPTTGFSPFSPVQKADLERVLRVERGRSPTG